MSVESNEICSTVGCNKSGASLRCPQCLKQGITNVFFCSQQCFKSNWKEHRIIHKKEAEVYDPWPFYSFSGPLRPYPITERRLVPANIERPDYATHVEGISVSEEKAKGCNIIKVLDEEEIEGVRVAGRLGREVMDAVAKAVDVGVTTDELDRIVHEESIEKDCYPSPLNYYQFPKSCCTSVNEVICHGIPDTRPLKNGDLVNVDITVYHRGFHGDLNETFFVGTVDKAAKKLTT
ncbi:Methionine aminopeptidase 1-like protein, partial [Leptotrombidium deliense]